MHQTGHPHIRSLQSPASPSVPASEVRDRSRAETRESDPERTGHIRGQLEDLKARLQKCCSDSRLVWEPLKPLRHLAAEAETVLEPLAAQTAAAPQDGNIDRLMLPLANAANLVARVENQFWLLDSAAEYTQLLRTATQELLHTRDVSPARLANLSRRILLDCRTAQHFDDLLPEPRMQLAESLPAHFTSMERIVFASGIQAARLAAWFGSRDWKLKSRIEPLVVAALLRDVGCLILAGGPGACRSTSADGRVLHDMRHPEVSAAVVANLRDYCVELPLWVAQHHERLDGTGYPRRMKSRQLHRSSRLLAAIDRFLELLTEVCSRDGRNAILNRMYCEAEQGELDQEMAELFVDLSRETPIADHRRQRWIRIDPQKQPQVHAPVIGRLGEESCRPDAMIVTGQRPQQSLPH